MSRSFKENLEAIKEEEEKARTAIANAEKEK